MGMMITRKAIPRRTMLRGLGATLALPLLDGMVPALTALQRTAARPVTRFGVMYVVERHDHAELDAGGRGRGVRADADAERAGAVPGSAAGVERAGLRADARTPRRRPRQGEHAVPHRRVAADQRDLPRCRHLDGSDRRARDGQAHAAGVARAGDRVRRDGGRLRRRLRLRLHQHHLLAQREYAAADREQSARRVRTAVRRQRQHRSEGAAGPDPAGPERARLGHRRGRAPPGLARAGRSHQARRIPRRHSRRGAAHPEGRGAERARAAAASITRRASRRPSTST